MTAMLKTLLPVVVLAAVGASATATIGAEYKITIAAMKFDALTSKLHVGDVIVWRNDDIFRHTATARDRSFDVDLPPKSEKRMTISQTGAVDFYCRFHPMMKGKLDVEP